ncbi:hypothetical protein GCM10011515_03120 [Tsuneonella deserti]|uniref:TFIIB-type zinc ribbon-containing protein n=1 Tax=Tsuneonella deserti TaxID=2035528 RepID=A0ABQ1S0R9_9SPHN|nr:hypothetical protein [Tsuneonella deserti]GGD87009.1 hypothetical protein GCM10011515_03120 [Tsuneonella deserti]
MDASKYSRSVTMLCPTCGNTDFEREGDNSTLRCVGCDRVFEQEELVRANGEVIEAELDEMKTGVLRDAKKELRDTLKKAFKGSKHIKFK